MVLFVNVPLEVFFDFFEHDILFVGCDEVCQESEGLYERLSQVLLVLRVEFDKVLDGFVVRGDFFDAAVASPGDNPGGRRGRRDPGDTWKTACHTLYRSP